MPGSTKRRIPIPQHLFNKICRDISSGKSLRRALKGNGMPKMGKLFDELERCPERGEQYARARLRGMETHIDALVELADTANAENAHAVRLKVDTRKWIASKLLPRIYGDNMRLELDVAPDLAEKLRRARERVIEAVDVKVLPVEPAEQPQALPSAPEAIELPSPAPAKPWYAGVVGPSSDPRPFED